VCFGGEYTVRGKLRVSVKNPESLPVSLTHHVVAKTIYSLTERGKERLKKTLWDVGRQEYPEGVYLKTLMKEIKGESAPVLLDWLDNHDLDVTPYYEVVNNKTPLEEEEDI
jgi:hypothetical protein